MTRTTTEETSLEQHDGDYELSVVPQSQRKGWLPISLIWIAIGIDLSGTILGVQLGAGMPFGQAVWATLLGSVLLGLLAMACTYVGAASGLTTAMISRTVFGRIGGILIAMIMAVSSLGWFGVQVGFFASNAQTAIGELTGVGIPLVVLNAAGGVLMMLTALWGYRSIEKLSSWAVPLLVAILFLGIVLASAKHGWEPLFAPVQQTFTFGGAVSLVMGIFVLGVVVSPDIARWAKTPRHAMRAGFIGFFIGNSLIVIVALVLSRLMGEEDLMMVFFGLGLGIAAIVVLTLAQWTTNTNNLYGSSLSLASIFTGVSRKVLTLAAGVVATVVACLGMYDAFIPFIAAMGVFLAPYGGVYVAEFFLGERTRFVFDGTHEEPAVRWPAIVSWAAGIFVALATSDPAAGLGLGLFGLTSIPALDGLVAAFLVQGLLTRLNRTSPKETA
ncbi:cytosine permease [Paeniglutamicibacter sp. R2-26]|uniref:cytosine permease n=1 Tax=Paeniglutamicibacter sp. R2-26 TaxID=3144417 RepID=UPI003EE64014